MLTHKQKALLAFIHDRMAAGEIAPSFDEMREALGLKSKSGVHRLIHALEERGYLRRLPHRARALEIVRLPEGIGEKNPQGHHGSAATPQIVELRRAPAPHAPAFEPIPLYGRIAAGTPIEAIRDEGHAIDVPPSLLGPGAHYALSVDGDSMIRAGIHDRDTIIIRRCETAEDGAIVVALIDDQEVTLKRLRRMDDKIALIPENEAYEPRIFPAHRVRIQGRMVGLLRVC